MPHNEDTLAFPLTFNTSSASDEPVLPILIQTPVFVVWSDGTGSDVAVPILVTTLVLYVVFGLIVMVAPLSSVCPSWNLKLLSVPATVFVYSTWSLLFNNDTTYVVPAAFALSSQAVLTYLPPALVKPMLEPIPTPDTSLGTSTTEYVKLLSSVSFATPPYWICKKFELIFNALSAIMYAVNVFVPLTTVFVSPWP